MKRVISLQYSSARLLGVNFRPEQRGKVMVGVAVVTPEQAKPFEGRDDFEVEDVDSSEVSRLPDDLPLLAPQRAALVKAGLDDLDKLAAHDFAANKVAGIGEGTVQTIQTYLKGLKPQG